MSSGTHTLSSVLCLSSQHWLTLSQASHHHTTSFNLAIVLSRDLGWIMLQRNVATNLLTHYRDPWTLLYTTKWACSLFPDSLQHSVSLVSLFSLFPIRVRTVSDCNHSDTIVFDLGRDRQGVKMARSSDPSITTGFNHWPCSDFVAHIKWSKDDMQQWQTLLYSDSTILRFSSTVSNTNGDTNHLPVCQRFIQTNSNNT